jgi:hypothetical protein
MMRTGCAKVSAAIAQVAKDRKASERTIWQCWKEFEDLARTIAWVKTVIPDDSANEETEIEKEWRDFQLQQSRD